MNCSWHTCDKSTELGLRGFKKFCSKQCKNKYYVDRRRKASVDYPAQKDGYSWRKARKNDIVESILRGGSKTKLVPTNKEAINSTRRAGC